MMKIINRNLEFQWRANTNVWLNIDVLKTVCIRNRSHASPHSHEIQQIQQIYGGFSVEWSSHCANFINQHLSDSIPSSYKLWRLEMLWPMHVEQPRKKPRETPSKKASEWGNKKIETKKHSKYFVFYDPKKKGKQHDYDQTLANSMK